MKPIHYLATTGLALLLAIVGLTTFDHVTRAQGRGAAGAPNYRVVPLWPQPFQDDSWVLGSITGVTVDAQNHVWVAHRADSLETNEKGMVLAQPSSSVCCTPAPPILEFDSAGKLVSSWGGTSQGYQWPQVPGGIAVDPKGNVWITAAGIEPAPQVAGAGRGAAATAAAEAAEVGIAAGGAGRGAAPAGAAPAGAGRGAATPAPAVPADAHVL